VRVLIFHGYLLGGTGSNVYNARLAEALARLGHDVHLLCQERRPQDHPFLDAAGDWDGGALRVRPLLSAPAAEEPAADGPAAEEPTAEEPAADGPAGGPGRGKGRCTVYRPEIAGLLPVYVADAYEGVQARTFAECSEEEVARYIELNVAAVREVAALVRPQVALANHLVMGPVILARALAGEVPYAVKIHGSALEYTVRPQPERFLELAREGLASAAGVLVGSRHTASSLWRTLDREGLQERTRLGPPGVDVRRFAPREPQEAAAALRALSVRLCEAPPAAGNGGADAFKRDERAAGAALARLRPREEQLVAFVGKLIVSKGVDLLLAAWPLVLAQAPHARLAIVGFGAYREGLEELRDALVRADLSRAREIALAGRALEGASPQEGGRLRHLLAFLGGLEGTERERYLAAASELGERVVLVGRLDHEELAELLPACEALVVPSTFPESFGMVAAEAAACGVLPVSAAHSGLAEVSGALAGALPSEAAALLSFPVDDGAVRAIATRVLGWLAASPVVRAATRERLVATARERWSWEGVARGVLAAASGELEGLARP
jgi:glycosyltransferase involved in cell wall biosynthesis